jgi:hypothetical protein
MCFLILITSSQRDFDLFVWNVITCIIATARVIVPRPIPNPQVSSCHSTKRLQYYNQEVHDDMQCIMFGNNLRRWWAMSDAIVELRRLLPLVINGHSQHGIFIASKWKVRIAASLVSFWRRRERTQHYHDRLSNCGLGSSLLHQVSNTTASCCCRRNKS